MDFDSNYVRTKPQQNVSRMDYDEMSKLGNLLESVGKTLISAAGRLERYDSKHHQLFTDEHRLRGILARSPSALNDAVESLCMHSWNIRNQVNDKVGINQLIPSDEIEAWTKEITVLTSAKQTTSDEHLAKALETSIASLLERIDKARDTTGNKNEENYLKPSTKGDVNPASLREADEIDVLMSFYGGGHDENTGLFGDVGKHQLESAIRRLKREGITHIFQLLNAPKQMILDMVADKDDIGWEVQTVDVLTEVLHSYGFKWRTGGKSTRFDLPVSRFLFSREAYRTRSERRAATAFLNAAKGKKGAVLGGHLREWIDFILNNANQVAAITYEDRTITSDPLVENWFDAACSILNKFKGVIPERLWLVEIHVEVESKNTHDRTISRGFRSRLVDAIEATKEQEIFLRKESVKGANVVTYFSNNDISGNHYLNCVDRERNHPQEYKLAGTHALVHNITHIIFQWVQSMELQAMQDAPTLDGLNAEYVWDTALSQYGWMPFAWHTKNLVPHEMDGEDHFVLVEPIELGEKLEYRNEN